MEQKVKRVPVRQCLGCNEHKPKGEMIRIVKTPTGELKVDFRGKVSGRGAYICPSVDCFRRACRAKRIERALEIPAIPEEVMTLLEASIADEEGV